MTLRIVAPVSGRVLPLSEVPDPVFSAALVGPGAAIDPPRGTVEAVAPITGTVVKLHPHAYVVASADGAAVLVHLGIDTVQLGGEGFALHVRDGEAVTSGQLMVSFDASAIEAGGRSPVCPVIALDATADQLDDVRDSGDIGSDEALFTLAR